jgi:sporulation protein YlmC with PRC-barrel domain
VRKLIATTALALVIGGPAVAQQQDQQTQQPGQDQMAGQDQQMMAGQNFYQPQANDLFVSDLMDAEVYAPSRDAQQEGAVQQPGQAPGTTATTQQDQAAQQEQAADQQEQAAEQQEQAAEQQQAATDDPQQQQAAEQQEDAAEQQQQAADQQQDAAQQQQMQQDQAMTGQQMGQAGTGMGLQTRAIQQDELEGMDSIGSVSDVIVDEQGEIRAIVLDVGGFLGIGAREVALSTDQIEFGYDQENPDQFYVISQVTAEELENAPEFDRDQLRQQRDEGAGVAQDEQQDAAVGQQPAPQDRAATDPGAQQDPQWRGDRQALAAPQMQREGFQQAEAQEITADNLLGANVYDVNDENIGSVSDIVMGAEGQAEYAVIDIGGFLGLGTHTVAIGFDEMQVLHDEGWADLRVYVDASQEELENMPEYEATN